MCYSESWNNCLECSRPSELQTYIQWKHRKITLGIRTSWSPLSNTSESHPYCKILVSLLNVLYRDIAFLSFSDSCILCLHDTEDYCSTGFCPTFQVFVHVDRAFTLRFAYILDGYTVYFVYESLFYS